MYIPSRRLAFEYNGLYWHSSLQECMYPGYHLDKTLEAERLGIRLVHIWSDDWILKPEIMQAKIRSLLNIKPPSTVYARNCAVMVPTALQKQEFYQKNHIKGDGAGRVSYALQASDMSIVAMATFKVLGEGVFDLNRFAVDISTHVPGAFSKLLAHFKRNNDWTSITTYADRSWSQGNVYKVSGFTLAHTTPPAFHGLEYGFSQRVSRRAYTHARLASRFPQSYDPTKTQLENMDLAGVPVIYDCGNYAFTLSR